MHTMNKLESLTTEEIQKLEASNICKKLFLKFDQTVQLLSHTKDF
jgi:hypothetical protein